MKNKVKIYENDKEFINSFQGQSDKEIENRLKNVSLVSLEDYNYKGDCEDCKDFFSERFKTENNSKNPKNVYDEEDFLEDIKSKVHDSDKYRGETKALFYKLSGNEVISATKDFLKKDDIDLEDFDEEVASKFYDMCYKSIDYKDLEKEDNLRKSLEFIKEHLGKMENLKDYDMDLTFKNGEKDNFSLVIKNKDDKEIVISDESLNRFLDKTIKYIVTEKDDIDFYDYGLELDEYEYFQEMINDLKEDEDYTDEEKKNYINRHIFETEILANDLKEIDLKLPTYYKNNNEKSDITEVNFHIVNDEYNKIEVSMKDKWNTPYEQFADKKENVITFDTMENLLQDEDFFKAFSEEYQEKNYLDKDISHNLVMIENMNKYEKFEETVNNIKSKAVTESFLDTMKEVNPEIVFGETMKEKTMEKFDKALEERFGDMSENDKYFYLVNNADELNIPLNEENEIVDLELEKAKEDIDFENNIDEIIKTKFGEKKQELSEEILDKTYQRFAVIPLAEITDKYEKQGTTFNEKQEEYIDRFTEKYIEDYKNSDNEKSEKKFKEEINNEIKKHINSLSEDKLDKSINNYLEKNNLKSLDEVFGNDKKEIKKEVEEIKEKDIDKEKMKENSKDNFDFGIE